MKASIKIEGMMCSKCAQRVTNALTEAGAQGVVILLEDKLAEVEYPEAVMLDALKAAVEDAGYDVID